MDAEDAIGRRARLIRRRRGLSLDAAAGLAGISKSHLSRLETGKRGFEPRGLLEDLAAALACAVADLAGQPYLPPDRATAAALSTLADRIAPGRIRHDPIARDLVTTLDHRAKRRVWELDSLRHRFGVG